MTKLLTLPDFNRPVNAKIQLPYPQASIVATITVIILKNNQVDLYGHITNQSFAQQILQAGRERLDQWHQEQQAKREALLVGPDGQPVTGPAGAA